MIYAKSFLTGLAALFAALPVAGIILIARSWVSLAGSMFVAVDGRSALVFSFLAFAAGFFGL
jgi:hypothetical protein